MHINYPYVAFLTIYIFSIQPVSCSVLKYRKHMKIKRLRLLDFARFLQEWVGIRPESDKKHSQRRRG